MQIETGNIDIVWRGSILTVVGDLCQLGTAWGGSTVCRRSIFFRPWERSVSERELSEVD